MGATLGAAFGVLVQAIHPMENFGPTTCAVIGMAAMVGGGTGAAMTAVTMIFEMTRDYDMVMPSIVAVALAIGVRRLLSPENIYTIKLVGRGHFIPKALYANMFLVRRARDVMQKDVTLLTADAHFDAFLRQHGEEHGLRQVVVTRGNHIAGVVQVNTSLRRGSEQAYSGVRLGDVAHAISRRARERYHVRCRSAADASRRCHGDRRQGSKPGPALGCGRHHLQGPDRRLGRRQHQAIQLMIAPRCSCDGSSRKSPAIQTARCDFRNASVAARSTAPPEITTP